jgi:thiamine biosynthesis protein ThiS
VAAARAEKAAGRRAEPFPLLRRRTAIFFREIEDNAMELYINGEKSIATEGVTTLLELLEQRGIKAQAVVVERNLALVDRKDFAVTRLEPGDRLEILHFVGGG